MNGQEKHPRPRPYELKPVAELVVLLAYALLIPKPTEVDVVAWVAAGCAAFFSIGMTFLAVSERRIQHRWADFTDHDIERLPDLAPRVYEARQLVAGPAVRFCWERESREFLGATEDEEGWKKLVARMMFPALESWIWRLVSVALIVAIFPLFTGPLWFASIGWILLANELVKLGTIGAIGLRARLGQHATR